jgi:hypothetical protein
MVVTEVAEHRRVGAEPQLTALAGLDVAQRRRVNHPDLRARDRAPRGRQPFRVRGVAVVGIGQQRDPA